MKRKNQAAIPWIPLLILAATVYLFWLFPMHRPAPKMELEFEQSGIGR